MRPPKKIRVGPYTFRVIRSSREIAGEAVGDTSPRRSRIRYTDDQCPMQIRSTILHEVLHAIAHTAGIGDEEALKQEDFISRCEAGFLGVLRDNPKLLAYLTDETAA